MIVIGLWLFSGVYIIPPEESNSNSYTSLCSKEHGSFVCRYMHKHTYIESHSQSLSMTRAYIEAGVACVSRAVVTIPKIKRRVKLFLLVLTSLWFVLLVYYSFSLKFLVVTLPVAMPDFWAWDIIVVTSILGSMLLGTPRSMFESKPRVPKIVAKMINEHLNSNWHVCL